MTVASKPPLYGLLHGPRPWALVQADAIALLRQMPDNVVDAVITDPPYGIGFAGERWDGGTLASGEGFQAFTAWWAEQAARVLKPGGYLAAFGSPRTFHRLVCGIEESGLDIRDQMIWFYGGAGFAKSRRIPEQHPGQGVLGTALKPAYEPILLARKPLEAGLTALEHVRTHGTGAMQIEAASIPKPADEKHQTKTAVSTWPAHLALTHCDDCGTGTGPSDDRARETETSGCVPDCPVPLIDRIASGAHKSQARLFYAAKAIQNEREAGLNGLPGVERAIFSNHRRGQTPLRVNTHPTVKPIAVMRHLVRLLTPPDGTVLDPFTGSGSTGIASVLEGRPFFGIEREAEYTTIASARIRHWRNTQ